MKRLARVALRLYPRWWQERYGSEVVSLLDDTAPGWRAALDLVRGGLIMRLTDIRTLRVAGVSVGAVAILVLATTAVLSQRMFVVSGASMAPALGDGDRFPFASVRSPDDLHRGDIVLFRSPRDQTKIHMKRIVGLPGEQVMIRQGAVTVDGKPMAEPYVAAENRSAGSLGPYRLGRDEYLLLGDNRSHSEDSRHFGPVARQLIIGKVEE